MTNSSHVTWLGWGWGLGFGVMVRAVHRPRPVGVAPHRPIAVRRRDRDELVLVEVAAAVGVEVVEDLRELRLRLRAEGRLQHVGDEWARQPGVLHALAGQPGLDEVARHEPLDHWEAHRPQRRVDRGEVHPLRLLGLLRLLVRFVLLGGKPAA
eukprot:scaffold26429_cov64-Phaeocystis_antarctica.AAC.1